MAITTKNPLIRSITVNADETEVVLLGHILRVGDYFADLRDNHSFDDMKRHVGFWDMDEDNKGDYVTDRIIHTFIKDYLLNKNGFVRSADTNSDYEAALASDDWQLRAMVALNGRDHAILAKDAHPSVREKLVMGLLNDREDGIKVTDLSWLDAMVNDDFERVRELVAQFGLQKHLDILVSDESPMVRAAVAAHGYIEHLDVLVNDESDVVRMVIAKLGFIRYAKQLACDKNPRIVETIAESCHATKELLSNPNQGAAVIVNVAKHGFSVEIEQSDILKHKNTKVQAVIELAKRGLLLDELVSHEDERVRALVATHAKPEHLEALKYDKNLDVRLEVTKQYYSRHSHKPAE